ATLSADLQLAHMLGKDFEAEASVKSTEEDNHISDMLFEFLIQTEGRDEQGERRSSRQQRKRLTSFASSSARLTRALIPKPISPLSLNAHFLRQSRSFSGYQF